jgi:thymidylate kinase
LEAQVRYDCPIMLITLYGINNIGKTTHTVRLVERLRAAGHDAVRVKFPVYDVHPSGDFLNKVLRDGGPPISEEELQMWFVLNRYQFQPTLKGWLDEGKIVVAEDYVGTGIAWGTTKGLETEWLETLNRNLIKEDVAILMDGERYKNAIEEGHLHEENHDLVDRCREVHLELGAKYDWVKVDLQPEKEDTSNLIWDAVAPHLPS